jgi:hypothetical protein
MSDEYKVLFTEIEDDCKLVLNLHLNSFLKDKVFNNKDVDFMMNHLNDLIIPDLIKISPHFKFILSFTFLQHESSGFTQNMALYYDKETDGCITQKFSFKGIICIVNLFCLSI